MKEIKINSDLIKLFLINCAIKITKEEPQSTGGSLISFLQKMDYESFLNTHTYYLLAYEYQDFVFEDYQKIKIRKILFETKDNKHLEEIINKIKIDNSLLDIFNMIKPIIKKAANFFMDLLEKVEVLPENSNNVLEEISPILENVEIIDRITDSIDIRKIVNSNKLLTSLENHSLLKELVNTLKSKSQKVKSHQKSYYDIIINSSFLLNEKINTLQININRENTRIFAKGLEILNNFNIRTTQLAALKTIYEELDSTFNFKSNMELSYNFGYRSFFSIEMYIAIIKEQKIDPNNSLITNKLKEKLEDCFINYDNKNLYSTLLYKCLQKDYIKEAFDLIEMYNLKKCVTTLEIFILPNMFKEKINFLDYITTKYESNVSRISMLNTQISSSSNPNIKIEKEIKEKINLNIEILLSKYLTNNDLLHLYMETP